MQFHIACYLHELTMQQSEPVANVIVLWFHLWRILWIKCKHIKKQWERQQGVYCLFEPCCVEKKDFFSFFRSLIFAHTYSYKLCMYALYTVVCNTTSLENVWSNKLFASSFYILIVYIIVGNTPACLFLFSLIPSKASFCVLLFMHCAALKVVCIYHYCH